MYSEVSSSRLTNTSAILHERVGADEACSNFCRSVEVISSLHSGMGMPKEHATACLEKKLQLRVDVADDNCRSNTDDKRQCGT